MLMMRQFHLRVLLKALRRKMPCAPSQVHLRWVFFLESFFALYSDPIPSPYCCLLAVYLCFSFPFSFTVISYKLIYCAHLLRLCISYEKKALNFLYHFPGENFIAPFVNWTSCCYLDINLQFLQLCLLLWNVTSLLIGYTSPGIGTGGLWKDRDCWAEIEGTILNFWLAHSLSEKKKKEKIAGTAQKTLIVMTEAFFVLMLLYDRLETLKCIWSGMLEPLKLPCQTFHLQHHHLFQLNSWMYQLLWLHHRHHQNPLKKKPVLLLMCLLESHQN